MERIRNFQRDSLVVGYLDSFEWKALREENFFYVFKTLQHFLKSPERDVSAQNAMHQLRLILKGQSNQNVPSHSLLI